MSKAGAVATSQMRKTLALRERIDEDGLLVVAMEEWMKEEEQRVATGMQRMVRIMAMLGIPHDEPFVLEQFEVYNPSQRVCVRAEGLLFNYLPQDGDSREGVSLIAGACTKCGERPAHYKIEKLSDISYIARPQGKKWLETFVCWKCEEDAE